MRKKQKFTVFISLILIAVLIVVVFQMGIFSLLYDNMEYYDDFSAGFRSDLWDITTYKNIEPKNPIAAESNPLLLINTINNKLTTNQIFYDAITPYTGDSLGVIQPILTSKQKFSTEDIKISVLSSSSQDGYCTTDGPREYSPTICYGNDCMGPVAGGIDNSDQGCHSHTNGAVLYEIKRYDDLDLSKYVWLVNGAENKAGQNVNPESIIIKGSTVVIDDIKFEPYFSCNFDKSTEVIVQDKFSSGSAICYGSPECQRTLTYLPTKICPEDLGVIIIDEQQGISQELGSITKRVAQGEKIIVPQGQAYYYRYITKYVNEMQEKCNPLNQEYSTELKRCVSSGVQQEIATPILLYCEQDSNCILPPSCEGTTAQCVENQCNYASATCSQEQILNYLLVLETINLKAPLITTIGDGVTKITFSGDDVMVAGQHFRSSTPSVRSDLCPVTDGFVRGEGCYEVIFIWEGIENEFLLSNGEERVINDYITVKYEMTGKGAYNGQATVMENGVKVTKNFNYKFIKTEDHINTFTITLKNILDVKLISYPEKSEKGQPHTAKIELTNNLFDISTAGYLVKLAKSLSGTYTETQKIATTFAAGVNTKDITIPASLIDEYGVYSVEVIPYFEILPEINYFSAKAALYGFYIAQSEEIQDCNQASCSIGVCQSNGICLVQTQCDTNFNVIKHCLDGTEITTYVCVNNTIVSTGNECVVECSNNFEINSVCEDGSEITTHKCVAGKLTLTSESCTINPDYTIYYVIGVAGVIIVILIIILLVRRK
jgi:hypothetical protein